MSSNFLDKLRDQLSCSEPRFRKDSASVAVVIDEMKRVLMIRRAEKEDDPWSNQMAFPGGKREPSDESYLKTAVRETMEELGINLHLDSEFLGYMDSFKTHSGKMYVVPSVFYPLKELKPRPNGEVSDFYWIELPLLQSRRTRYGFYRDGKLVENEAFLYGDCIIWGLSYRIIVSLLSLLGLRG